MYSPDPGRLIADPRYAAEQMQLLWQKMHQVDLALAADDQQITEITKSTRISISRFLPVRQIVSEAVQLLQGTHATRPPAVAKNQFYWETDRLHLYYTAVSGTGFAWRVINGTGPMRGTLSPDQKPTDLTASDEGFRFFSTDFDRIYRWSGTAWADAHGQPARGTIAFFLDSLTPGTGWQLCDGTATTRSTSTGTTAAFTVPDLTTANRFLRSVSGATGGTSGAATHTHGIDPPNRVSTGPSSLTLVDNDGTLSTVNVGSATHTHDVDIPSFPSDAASSLPPAYDARPYIRL